MSFFDRGDLPIKIGDTLRIKLMGQEVKVKTLRYEKQGDKTLLIYEYDGQELAMSVYQAREARVVF